MNTLDKLKYQNRVAASLKDSRESIFGKPLLDFFSQETPFFNARFHEEENHFHWDVEVPGITKENLTIRIDGRSMLVTGKEKKVGDVRFVRTLFHHTFRIPSTANTKKVIATCRNGALKISIAKLKPMQVHRTIQVQGDDDRAMFTSIMSSWNSLKERVLRLQRSIERARTTPALKGSIGKLSIRPSE